MIIFDLELHEVRRQVARQRNSGRYQPFRLFYGSSNSISVSDICGGLWCEQQVEYRHLYPYLQRTNEWKRVQAERKKHIPRRTATMETGTQIHYRKGWLLIMGLFKVWEYFKIEL